MDKYKNKQCLICYRQLINLNYCDDGEPEDKLQQLIINGRINKKLYVYDIFRADGKDSYFCEYCVVTYLPCECNNFCKYIGNYGYNDNGRTLQYNRPHKGYKNEKHSWNCYEYKDYVKDKLISNNYINLNIDETYKCKYCIPYYVGHLDLQYYKWKDEESPCGPDGGYPTFWKCINKQCDFYNKVFCVEDK